MFNSFLQSYHAFQNSGVADPLLETLHLFDLLSGGALRKVDLCHFCREEIDLPYIARKRKEGMPLQCIIGRAIFMGLDFFYSPSALIPREETELFVKVALSFVKKKQKFERDLTIIDMGTGCGNIAVSLAMNSENAKILASDISPAAVELAQRNVNKFNLQQRISLFCGDLFSPFHGPGYEGRIDMIVCNPPYIPTTSLSKLPSEIIDYEPTVALDAGAYGIGFFRRLVSDSTALLKPGGILTFEIGVGQEKLVTRLIQRNETYGDIEYFDDGEQIRVISTTKRVRVGPD